MKFKVLWSPLAQTLTGLPRPFSVVLKESRDRVKRSGKHIANKVPIPWQSFSRFDIGRALGVIKEHENAVVHDGLCAYCGLGFEPNEESIIWITYPDNERIKEGGRVFSDHFPFHITCMKEVRLFCPHMKTTKDEEFLQGVYSELIVKSLKYYSVTSTQLTASSDHS